MANVVEVMTTTRGHPWVLALGGHMHTAEQFVFQTESGRTRFEQTSAVVGAWETDSPAAPSGVTFGTCGTGRSMWGGA